MKSVVVWILIILGIGASGDRCPIWWLPPVLILVISVGLAIAAYRAGLKSIERPHF